jgi:carbon-monoxide dehydrogenase medium subunit
LFDQGSNFCREAKIALGAVAPTPVRAPQAESILTGRALTEESIEEAAEQASKEAHPVSDVRGSATYRREVIKVLTKRTLKTAWETYLAQNGVEGWTG